MNEYLNISCQAVCPVCSHGEGTLLYSIDCAQAAQHFVLRERDPVRHARLRDHIHELWNGDRCDLVRCAGCGFGYSWPFVGGDKTFYDLAYSHSAGHYPDSRWEYRVTLDVIETLVRERTLPAGFRALEIGAGDGAFVRRIAPALTAKENVLCTEFSDYGRDQIRGHGIECVSTDIRQLDPPAPFHIICLFQVVEHLDRLDALFRHLARFGASDAHLFIAVPNQRRVEFNERHGALRDLPPNHIGRWNRRGFEVIGRNTGWSLRRHEVERGEPVARLKEFVYYRHLQARQRSGSIANLAARWGQGRSGRALEMAFALGASLGFLRLLPAAASPDLGGSQWVHLQKAA